MQLQITRDQSKALMGGVKFELQVKAVLTPEESELVKKYKVQKEVLVKKSFPIPFTQDTFEIEYKIEDFTDGFTRKCKSIGEILETETVVKEACQAFKHQLDAMKGFGGREVIEL